MDVLSEFLLSLGMKEKIPFVNKAPIDQQKGDVVTPMANLNLKEKDEKKKGAPSQPNAAKLEKPAAASEKPKAPESQAKPAAAAGEKPKTPEAPAKPAAASGNAPGSGGGKKKNKNKKKK